MMRVGSSGLVLVSGLVILFVACGAHGGDERFPFVIPGDDASPSVTNLAPLSPRPAGAEGFVRVRGSHFATDAGRIRFWGVNTCFGANFPERADAEKVAAHLAKLGVNAVRMHHHDTAAAPRGIWGQVVNGKRTLDPAQLERQDYFLAALHRYGIYANLNLHVGRELTEAEGFPRAGLPYATRMDKYLLYFEPRAQAALKEFCREYLLHENPHRKLRRVDDPGIALIEITNENAFSRDGPALAASLPEPHRGEFRRQWNEWLARRYPSTAALREAWSGGNEPLGAVVVDSAAWRDGPGGWRVKQSREAELQVAFGREGPQPDSPAVRLTPQAASAELSANEIQHPNLGLEPGRSYTLVFWARATAPRSIFVDVSNAGPGNWNPVGFSETLQLGPEWQRIQRVFRASETIPGATRICFKFGTSRVPFELAGVTLQRGAEWIAVPPGQSLEARTIDIPIGGWSKRAQDDAARFMTETETAFLRDLIAFLKNDLGVRVPITASQINYHGAEIVAATCDYVDIHAYWQHPRFPRKPWDPVDWNIANTPMERAPHSDALLNRAPWRLLDRPFTLSEWNIPDPNDYAASVVPFAALIAALQDWDGIFFFQYQSGGEGGWYADKVQRFFSFNGNPVKLALFTAFAAMFRRGDLAPLAEVAAGTTAKMLPAALGFTHRIGIDPRAERSAGLVAEKSGKLATPDGCAGWDASDPARAHVRLNAPATRAVWGLVGGERIDLGGVSFAFGELERGFAVAVLTSIDGAPIERTKRALLVLVGSAENPGMKWNATRTSVGNQWGAGPAQVNGIPAEIAFPRTGARLHALDGRGQRVREVAPQPGSAGARFKLGPEQRTLWYELEW